MNKSKITRLFHTVTKGRSKALGLELLTLLEEQDNTPDPKLNEEEILNLVHRGADLTLVSGRMETSLSLAAGFHCQRKALSIDVIKAMVDHGADVNHHNVLSRILCNAASKHDFRAATYLMENGADVNLSDDRGNAPLHYAALFNTHENVRTLVEKHGADIMAKNKENLTPVEFLQGHAHQHTPENKATLTYLKSAYDRFLKNKATNKRNKCIDGVSGKTKRALPIKGFKGFKGGVP